MMFNYYAVLLDTTFIIVAGEKNDLLLQNAINAGFKEEQIEILTQEHYDERKALEPAPSKPVSEIEFLRQENERLKAEDLNNKEAIAEIYTMVMGGF